MWKEPYVYCADFLPLTAGTGTNYQPSINKIFENYNWEMVRTIYQATDGRINLRIMNASSGYDLVRQQGDIRAISSSAFSGISANGFVPYNLPVPYVLGAGSELVVYAADASNASNRLRFAMHGNRIYNGEAPYTKRLKREAFSFTIASGSIAAYSTVTVPFILDSSWGFLTSKLTGTATGVGTIFIQDNAPWSSNDVHFYNMVGNSQFGNALTSKKWTPEKSKLSIRFTDLSGSTNAFRITFTGERVYV